MSFGFAVGDFIATYELASKLRQTWVDAPQEYAAIRNEIKNVENILRDLNDLSSRVDTTTQQINDLTAATRSCTEVLQHADRIVEKYSSPPSAGRVRRAWKRLKSDPEDVRHVREQLLAAVTQLSAIQNNIELNMVQAINDDVRDMSLNSNEQERLRIANWFAPASFADQQNQHLTRRQKGTLGWLLQHPYYLKWRGGLNETVFCPGIPGSGKTIVVATIVDELQEQFAHHEDTIVVYFYCNFRRQNEQKLQQILAALVRQLFQERSAVPQSVQEVYQKHMSRGTWPTSDELYGLLKVLLRDYSKIFILIDALDECSNSDGTRDRLISQLTGMQQQPSFAMNLLTTCRPGIVNHFDSNPRLEIRAQKGDIKRFLEAHMIRLAPCVQRNQQIQHEILRDIIENVDGMFLLAYLHFESLQDKTTIRAVRDALKKLPRGSMALHAAYDEVRIRIDSQAEGFRSLARKTLTWMTYAREELTMNELREAIAIEPDMTDIDPETDLDDGTVIVSVCAGLLTVDEESDIVRFVHYTLQEYLERVRDSWLPGGADLVAQSCITYLSMEVLYEKDVVWKSYFWDMVQRHNFLRYAGENWGYHVDPFDQWTTFVKFVTASDDVLFLLGQLVLGQYKQDNRNSYRCILDISALHLSAYFNQTKAFRHLVDKGHNVNCRASNLQTPLHIAVRQGHGNVTTSYAARSCVNMDRKYSVNATTLRPASLEQNGKISAQYTAKQTLNKYQEKPTGDLHTGDTVEDGYSNIIAQLLAYPDIDINARDERDFTPLRWAAMNGSNGIVAQLLACSAIDVNVRDDYGHTPLHMASLRGHRDVVAQLLAHPDVAVNLRSEYGVAPLNVATFRGHNDIVAQLLTHPTIDPNLEDGDTYTALHWAALNGNSNIVAQLLARKDLKIDVLDHNGESPLDKAIRGNRDDVVALFRARYIELGIPVHRLQDPISDVDKEQTPKVVAEDEEK